MSEHLLFLTGKLAKPSLEKVLGKMQLDFSYTVQSLGLSVAALMTTSLIIRRLKDTGTATRVILPGRFRGDLNKLEQHFHVPFERGPEELKDLPGFFGKGAIKPDLSRYALKIFAEITEAPQLRVEQIVQQAETYRKDGADVIDLGFLPDTPFNHLQETIAALKTQGHKVSIDTTIPEQIIQASAWGADYILSLTEETLWVANEIAATPVLIPNTPEEQASLYRCVDRLLEQNKPFIADALLNPVHHGFTDSIAHYYSLRKKYPDIEILLGVGNVTELMHADTLGMNALLLGMASELNIRNILTTQVSEHCCKAVKEADVLRRILHYASTQNMLPANISPQAMSLHERKPFPYDDSEIAYFAKHVKDPGFRIQVNASGIHIYNRDGKNVAKDPFELYPHLNVSEDGGHAFYLGVELARAQIAWQLGKRYVQDEELGWGCATEKKTEDLSKMKEEGVTLKEKREKLKKASKQKTECK